MKTKHRIETVKKRKACEQCGRLTVRRVDGLAVCRMCGKLKS